MTPTQFITSYRAAFGENALLPIAFGFSDTPRTKVKHGIRCIVGAFKMVFDGRDITLEGDFINCAGGRTYLGKQEMAERTAVFVSETECYKQTPALVKDYVAGIGIVPVTKQYLNFMRIDHLDSWDGIEALIFFATPDTISGLAAWAFYDRNEPDTVTVKFGSGCASTIAFAVAENRLPDGYRCFLGMTDLSARYLAPSGLLAFTIPSCRLPKMLETLPHTALFNGKAWERLKARM